MSWQPKTTSNTGKFEVVARKAAIREGVLALGAGLPAGETLPAHELAAAFSELVSTTKGRDEALQYGWPEGAAALRQFVVDRLVRRGVKISPEDLIITSGAQQALELSLLALKTLVAPDARSVRVDPQTYSGALELMKSAGWQCSTDDAAPVVYAMPAIANPTGARDLESTTLVVRAHKKGTHPTRWVIEDDAYVDIAFDGFTPPSLLALDRESTFHIGTLSKSVCPGLRVGWVVPPPSLARTMLKLKRQTDIQTSSLAQGLASTYLSMIDYGKRIDGLCHFYRNRAEAMMSALRRRLPGWQFAAPEGGFSLWIQPDVDIDETRFLAACLECGVGLEPGSAFRPVSSEKKHSISSGIRLCFSSLNELELPEAVDRLAHAVDVASR